MDWSWSDDQANESTQETNLEFPLRKSSTNYCEEHRVFQEPQTNILNFEHCMEKNVVDQQVKGSKDGIVKIRNASKKIKKEKKTKSQLNRRRKAPDKSEKIGLDVINFTQRVAKLLNLTDSYTSVPSGKLTCETKGSCKLEEQTAPSSTDFPPIKEKNPIRETIAETESSIEKSGVLNMDIVNPVSAVNTKNEKEAGPILSSKSNSKCMKEITCSAMRKGSLLRRKNIHLANPKLTGKKADALLLGGEESVYLEDDEYENEKLPGECLNFFEHSEQSDVSSEDSDSSSDLETPLNFQEEPFFQCKAEKASKGDIPWQRKLSKFVEKNLIKENSSTETISLEAFAAVHPIDFFSLILDQKIIKRMKNATNDYYHTNNDKKAANPHLKSWVDVTETEIKKFLGLLYLMGIVKKPGLRDYWGKDPLTDTPQMRHVFSRDRFSKILMNFRVVHQSKTNEEDPLSKIRRFIDRIIKNSNKHYIPSKNLSLDESMIAFKGRHKFKVYMPKKPTKHGFKAYVVTDASSGYALAWEMHSFTESIPFSLQKTLERILKPFRNQGYTVYMDRFYTSPELLIELLSHNIKACGTVLPGRCRLSGDLQAEIRTISPLGYRHYGYLDQTLAVWRDGHRYVYFLSTAHDATLVEGMRRMRKREKKLDPTGPPRQKIVLPEIAVQYNQYMGGVDRFDQKMAYYGHRHRSRKWQMKVFYYFLEVAMVNSYVLYLKKQQIDGVKPLSHKRYRMEVIRKLLNLPQLNKELLLSKKFSFDNSAGCVLRCTHKPMNCAICSAQGESKKRVRTSYKCQTCEVNVCALGCYDIHRKMNASSSIFSMKDRVTEAQSLGIEVKVEATELKVEGEQPCYVDAQECRAMLKVEAKKDTILESTEIFMSTSHKGMETEVLNESLDEYKNKSWKGSLEI